MTRPNSAHPRVDVIVPTYNYGHYLGACLQSLHEQTFTDFRVLIIDNASEDDTPEVVAAWLERDGRFEYVRNETNIGLRNSLQKAYALTDNALVMILSSDDQLTPRFLETAVAALDRHPECSFAYSGWYLFVDRNGAQNHGVEINVFMPHRESGVYDETALLLSHNWITNSFTLFRREVCDAIGGITPAQLHHVGDWFLWESFSAKGPAYYIHEPLGRYRSHANSESDRLMADESSAFDHLHFYDTIFQSKQWSWPIRLLAKANAARWLTGEPLSAIVRKMGCERAEPLMRVFVNRHRDDLYVGAAECILFYTPSQDYLDTIDNGLGLLREVLGRNPEHARARAVLDRFQARQVPGEGGGLPAGKRRQVVVLSVDDTDWACAQIRLLQPLARIADEFETVWAVRNEGGAYLTNLSLLSGADLVLIQRIYAQQRLKHYLEMVFDLGRPVIYEIDDLMFDLPADNPHYAETLANREVIFEAMRRADAVTVSCPALAEAVRPYARKVIVLPNLVEADLFRAPVREPGEGVTLGLVGTPTHEKDFALVDEALEQALALHPGLRIVFMGLIPARWADHPAVSYVPFELDYRAYAGQLKSLGLDIALVPLQDNPFNRAKSNIKWLEYAAAGIAGIFSDLPPYDTVRDGETGLKVANRTESWLAAIRDLVEHPDKRVAIARAAQQEVLADWTTAARAAEYAEAYLEVLAGRPKTPLTLAEQGYDAGHFYEIWKQVHQPSLREAEWIAERIEAMPAGPLFHLAVIAPPGEEERLVRNIRDLSNQFYRRWRLTVVATLPYPEGLEALPQLNWIEAPGVHPHVTANQALMSAEGEGDVWVGLIEAGDGLSHQSLFRLADAINRHAAWRVVYTDEDRLLADGQRVEPHFRTDFNLDLLRSSPAAVGGLFVLRRDLFRDMGGLRPEMDGVESYDLALRALEAAGGAAFGHVADVLFHRFEHGGHCPRSAEDLQAARDTALMEHFARQGLDVDLGRGLLPDSYRVMYRHPAKPRVSVIIPTRNQSALLAQCVDSLLEKTAWPDFEVLIIDNGSDEPAALDYLARIGADPRVRVLSYTDSFNFSAMNNLAARHATGDYLLLLNNDTAVLHEDWLDEMMGHAQRPEVGIVGARLLFPDGKVQHAGVILGLGDTPAEHAFSGFESTEPGYAGRALLTQDYSVVTAACLLVRKSIYEAVEGLDETRFKVAFNDVDFCLKVRQAGWLVVWTPFAMLLHDAGSSQRGGVEAKEDADKKARFQTEREAMFGKWRGWIGFDPAYNRNLSFAGRDFKIEISPALTFDPDWRPRPRIIAHPADRMGCGEYRIIAPMRALNDGGRAMGWETGHYLSEPELFRFEPDSIVMQRQVEWSQIELIERYARHSKAFRVFELDDLLTNVPVKSSRKKDFVKMKDLHQRFRKAVALCNRFVVSTDYLAEEYQGYTDEVVAIPNYLERARWGRFKPLRRQGDKLRVGWAGSVTHDGDLLEIIDLVRATAREVDWIFFGMCPEELRPVIKEFHPPVPLEDYPAKLASLNLDLAVAPLEDVPFNHGKSHLRLLEYGILGFPVICTDITPYRGAYPVTRVANRYRDWVEAVRGHIADPDELARRGDALRDHIRAHWMLEDHLDVWLKAWLP
ncbi:MAG TPA: glycosyltransferase [Thiobacillaceae bacterium]|nr:glycosyltransferase [Thiobacillaceae bacterium]